MFYKVAEFVGLQIFFCWLDYTVTDVQHYCCIKMNIGFTLRKNTNQLHATTFPKVVSKKKILLLRHVDFQLSKAKKLIISMTNHTDGESQAQENTDETNLVQGLTQCTTAAV